MTEPKDLSGQRERAEELGAIASRIENYFLLATCGRRDGKSPLELVYEELEAIVARSTPAAIAQPGDGLPVSPAEGEVEEIAEIASEWQWGAGTWKECSGSTRSAYRDLARRFLSSPYITRLREQRDDLVRAAAEYLAAPYVALRIGESERRDAARTRLRDLVSKLNADTSGLSSRRDEMVTPSAEAASAIACGDKGRE